MLFRSEIKNPLTPIQLSAQRIRRRFLRRLDELPEEARVLEECVDTITSQVEGLKLLVNEFSNFARLPTAKLQAGDLNRLVREAVASYQESGSVALETALDPDLPTLEIDADQIRRLLSNLIDNAIAAVGERQELSPEIGRAHV